MTNNVDILLNNAFDAYNAGDFETAEALTRDALNQQPGQGDALYLLGLIAFQAGALDAATDLLYQAARLYPQVATYQLTLASVLQAQGRLDEAMTYYDKYPENALAWTQKGTIFLLKKQVSFARSAFDKALTLTPDLPEAVLGLAQCDRAIGDDVTAKQRLTALNAHHLIPDALWLVAQIDRVAGRWVEAESAINTALSLSERVPYLMEKGLISENQGDMNTALQAYHRAAELDPYQADAWINQGNIYQKQNRLSLAEDAYKRALQQDKTNPAAHHNLADVLYHQQRLPEALEHYRAVLAKHPDYLPSLYNLAVILEETGDYLEAAGLYFNILAQKGVFPHLDWRIADTLTALFNQNKAGQKEARRFAAGWVKNFPDNPIARHTNSALAGQGDLSALNDYTRLLYDDFAPEYDTRMQKIESTALTDILSLLPPQKYQKILYLGCGTGLFVRLFKGGFDTLIGVDVSSHMLTYASQTKAYTNLYNREAVDFLHTDKHRYDLILAVELIGYLPSFRDFLMALAPRLTRKGVFAFSVETASRSGLAPNGRYLYAPRDVDRLLSETGFDVLVRRETSLRRDEKTTAAGLLFVVRLNR